MPKQNNFLHIHTANIRVFDIPTARTVIKSSILWYLTVSTLNYVLDQLIRTEDKPIILIKTSKYCNKETVQRGTRL
jgi:hypothetical protein